MASIEDAKRVVEGLGTGWFVTVINLAPHSYGCGKFFGEKNKNLQCLTPLMTKLNKPLVSLGRYRTI